MYQNRLCAHLVNPGSVSTTMRYFRASICHCEDEHLISNTVQLDVHTVREIRPTPRRDHYLTDSKHS